MKKQIFALTLALGLTLTTLSVRAAGQDDLFPAVNSYPGYADVKEGDWFYDNAKLCYEIGLMNGTDKGFEPYATLPISQCAVVAARIRATLTGEEIPQPAPGEASYPWYYPYLTYLEKAIQADPSLSYAQSILSTPEYAATRQDFLYLLSVAVKGQELPAINSITTLPDTADDLVLSFYNAGILTGKDSYGTFDAAGTLTRAECAAMVSRVARSQLRLTFTPADYSPFTAAHLTPGTAMFTNGLSAEEFLIATNNAISAWETALGDDFNWHYVWTDGKSVLTHVKEDVLTALDVTAAMGTQAYENFDVQVYYSRLIDLTGKPLGDGQAAVQA